MDQGTAEMPGRTAIESNMFLDSARSSWAASSVGYQSKRSTQASFASSRTSYCSDFDFASSRSSVNCPSTQAFQRTSYSASIQPTFSPPGCETPNQDAAISIPPATIRPAKPAPDAAQARCPWCATTFTRRHDFKKHARDFHLVRVFWQCTGCGERLHSERQTKLHHRSRSFACRNLESTIKKLQRDRQHFGCPHCARYFGKSKEYLDHLATDCCPSKAPGPAHRSLQVRALLQQPGLVQHVETYSEQSRGHREAYKQLWWARDRVAMADLIERLEYGVQSRVDNEHPGIAIDSLDSFLRDLLAPSSAPTFEAETHRSPAVQSQPPLYDKPLPPLPAEEQQPVPQLQYHQEDIFLHTRDYLHQERDRGHGAEQQSYPSTVEEWRAQQPLHGRDPMIGGSYSDGLPQPEVFDEFMRFQWDHMDLSADPSQSRGFDATGSGLW